MALVRRAASGDTAAFEALVDRYYAGCLRFAVRMLGNRSDAEEAVQDTFVHAYRGLRSYRESDRFRGWLWRILLNRCRSLARTNRRRWLRISRYVAGNGLKTSPPRDPERIELGEVGRALLALPPGQREAFLLKHLDELSYEEMAAMTGASESALKMRVKRARDRLRELLDPDATPRREN